jgi:hypothetical protein
MNTYQKSILFVCLILSGVHQSVLGQGSKISEVNKNWQPGGIFTGKLPQEEILSARTANTKKFDRGNGLIDIYFGGPFHYTDQQGAWQDINLDIRSQTNVDYTYINQANRFISRFAQNAGNGMQMEYKNKPISFGIDMKVFSGNWSPVTALSQNTVVKENKIEYQNIYKDIHLGYEVSTSAINHTLRFDNGGVFSGIPAGQENVTIEETIQLPQNALLVDSRGSITDGRATTGNIFVVVGGDTVYTIKAAHIWDASFVDNVDEQSQSPEIIDAFKSVPLTVHFVSDTRVILSAQVPTSWLLSPKRVFPVIFDPTVIVSVANVNSFASSYRYPFNTCHKQRVSQILFRKSDINAGGVNTTGTITAIEFLQSTPVPMLNNNVEVKMQEVTYNNIPDQAIVTTGWFPVYGPSTENFMSGSNTWRKLNLSSQFQFTNTKNLFIEVRFNNLNATAGCTCTQTGPGGHWGYFDAPYHGHKWAYSNSATPPPSGNDCNYANTPEGNPSYGSLIPATKITINTTAGCAPISFTANLNSQSVVAPAQAQFSVSVSGTTPTYQWEYSTNGGGAWSNIPASSPYAGSTTNQLTVSPTSGGMNGYQYRCKVSNSCTTPIAISGVGVLTVNASGCNTVLGPPTSSTNLPVVAGGGSFKITVTPNTCNWSISATQQWISIVGALSGTGSVPSKSYTVTANNGGFRTGNIIVNGQTYTVNQLGIGLATTYTITGKVIKQDGSPLPGVSISANPVLTPATTDAQGYYTITAPNTYIGTIKPTLAAYTFTPVSISGVSSTNNSNINFQAVGATIKIASSSTIPPWQREGDDYGGTINVLIANTTTTSWHLEADVYDANNAYKGTAKFPSTTNLTYSFSASGSLLPKLLGLSKEGYTVKYVAVFDADNFIFDYSPNVTSIIEKKWTAENVVFYNDGTSSISIPLKYVSNTVTGAIIKFTRTSQLTSTAPNTDNIFTGLTGTYILLTQISKRFHLEFLILQLRI